MMVTAVHSPESIEAATSLLARGAAILGGGTIVMGQVNTGFSPAAELVSLHRLGARGVRAGGGAVRIGAMTTFAGLRECPDLGFLREAVRSIASPVVRNLATVGGNLFVEQPYGDFAVCLLALGATVEIAGGGAVRQAPVEDVLAQGVAGGEIVTAVSVVPPAPGTWFYHKAMRRKMNSASIVTVAAVVDRAEGMVTGARIALGGVAPRPVRAVSAERCLTGRAFGPEAVEEAGRAAAQYDIEPSDDAYASAWYRRRVLPVHLRRALCD